MPSDGEVWVDADALNDGVLSEPAAVQALLERLEGKIASYVKMPGRLPSGDDVQWLRTAANMLEESTLLAAELKKRKDDSLQLLQSTFGHDPDEVREMAESWGARAQELAAQLDQLTKDCEELCEKMDANQSDAGVDQLIIWTLPLEFSRDTFDRTSLQLRTKLAIDAMVGKSAEESRILEEMSRANWLLQEGIATSRRILTRKRRYKVKKPLIHEGEIVYAYSASDVETAEVRLERGLVATEVGQPWRTATVKSHREIGSGHGYGPSRVYTVHFHHKQEPEEVNDYEVYAGGVEEYKEVMRSSKTGITRQLFDEQSKDPWAKQIGWFVTDKVGEEEQLHFPLVRDARAAYDTQIIENYGLDEGLDEGLIWDWRWSSYRDGALDRMAAPIKAEYRCELRLRIMLMKEALPECVMKLLGDVLVEMSAPDQPLMAPDDEGVEVLKALDTVWTTAQKYVLGGCEQLVRRSIFHYALLMEYVGRRTTVDVLLRSYLDAEGDIDKFASGMPNFQDGYDASSSLDRMREFVDDNTPNPSSENDHVFIHAHHPNGITSHWDIIWASEPVQRFLKKYAEQHGTTVKSLRLKFNDRTIFLSSIRDKSPVQLGMTGGKGAFEVTFMQSPSAEDQASKPKPRANNKKGKRKKHKKSKKRSTQPASFESEEEKLRSAHSQAITHVLEEADATFRKIRQRLDAMNLERQLPKEKRSQPKPKSAPAEPLDTPPSDGLAGKAGKSHFIVQVGEVTNLYKTSKPSAARALILERSESTMLDLHGLTVDEALNKLDVSLAEWVETAMRGPYPWVIPVKIVCGGGGQVLSEAVENWIKRNDKVSNAPKNLFS